MTCTLRCRGGTKNCPIEISDLVMLHNKALEGLVKTDSVGYDLYSEYRRHEGEPLEVLQTV